MLLLLLGELPPWVFKNVHRRRFLVFAPGFRSCSKLLQFVRFWETIHTCVVVDVSAVPSDSPCSSLWIHGSQSYSHYLKNVPYSMSSTSYSKFDSDLVFVQSLFTVFCWSDTELFWRDFLSDLEFGVQVQGNPTGGGGAGGCFEFVLEPGGQVWKGRA
jgi:hypothetical protein